MSLRKPLEGIGRGGWEKFLYFEVNGNIKTRLGLYAPVRAAVSRLNTS